MSLTDSLELDNSIDFAEQFTIHYRQTNHIVVASRGIFLRGRNDLLKKKSGTVNEKLHKSNGKTRQFSVFYRQIQDANQRSHKADANEKLQKEYEGEILEKFKSSKSLRSGETTRLFTRLYEDSFRRRRTLIEDGPSSARVLSHDRVNELVTRLSTPRTGEYQRRESLRAALEEQELQELKEILSQRHPRRTLNSSTFKKLTATSTANSSHSQYR